MAAPATGMPISNHTEDQHKLEGREYIRWDDSRVQSKPDGEDEDIKAVAEMINEIQKAQYNSHRHCYTGKSDREFPLLLKSDLGDRHTCKNARHCEGHFEDRAQPTSTSQTEPICRRKRMASTVSI